MRFIGSYRIPIGFVYIYDNPCFPDKVKSMNKILLLLIVTIFISCTKSPVYEESQLIGTWYYNSNNMGIRITYMEDSTYTVMVRSARSRSKTMSGTWYIENNKLITNHQSSRSVSFNGEVDILKVTDSMMITKSEEGTADTTWRE